MSGKKSRTKGHGYERKIASDYRKLGYNASRGWQSRGAEQPDVVVNELNNAWIECQCSNRPTVFTKLEQAKRDRFDGACIVLHIKKSASAGKPPEEVVVVEKHAWFELLAAARRGGYI